MALRYMQTLLKEKMINVYPHLLSKEGTATAINIQFLLGEKRIIYGFDVLKKQVIGEYLYIDDKGETAIFERENSHYNYTDKQIGDLAKKYGTSDKLFLPVLYRHADNSLIKSIYEYLVDNIKVIFSSDDNDVLLFQEAVNRFKNPETQQLVQRFMKKIDLGIDLENDAVSVNYGAMKIGLDKESTGMKKLFVLLVLFGEALREGKVIFFDEYEKNLHVALATYFINIFNQNELNKNNAQLIFSAHNTSLLDLTLFRKDQIWFIDKNLQTMTTECYSLYNINDVLDTENVELAYIIGKYGATYELQRDGVKKDGK